MMMPCNGQRSYMPGSEHYQKNGILSSLLARDIIAGSLSDDEIKRYQSETLQCPA